MVATVDRVLSRISTRSTLLISMFVLCVVVGADVLTGRSVRLTVFYLVPIFLISWKFGRVPGAAAAMFCGTVWAALDFAGRPLDFVLAQSWNLLMKAGVFVAFAVIVSRVRIDLEEQTRLTNQLKNALAEVKQLSGLLPICAWCKKIRDTSGTWYPIETYVEMNSAVDFSHGICPDCAASRQGRG
jgi:hypothetical protein